MSSALLRMNSDSPPPIVMPDTEDGHREAWLKFPDTIVGFCHEWAEDATNPRICAHRTIEGDRRHSWCLRCLCGYPALHLSEKEQDMTRLGALNMNGW